MRKLCLAFCFVFVVCSFLMFATTAEGQQFPYGRQRIRCESNNGQRNQCNATIGGDVRISQQLSTTRCVEGSNWGWNRNGIWVDNGCRADFEFNAYSDPRGGQQLPSGRQRIRCESNNNQRNQCNASVGGDVRISQQLSTTRCVEGNNWGWNRNGIWVDNGCRADFEFNTFDSRGGNQGDYGQNPGGYGRDRGRNGDTQTITCESTNNNRRRTQCRANIAGNVRLTRQLSNVRCIQNRNWGWNQNNIWVSNGCRAEFTYQDHGRPGRRVGQGGYGYPNAGNGSLETLTCESDNNGYKECRVDRNIGDVRITQRLSNSSCEQGNSWSLKNQNTIWVNHGCRAVFEFRRS